MAKAPIKASTSRIVDAAMTVSSSRKIAKRCIVDLRQTCGRAGRHLILCGAVSLSMVVTASGQFSFRYPVLPASRVLDIRFLDGSTGFFSNEAGSIYRTTDGGATWVRRAHYQGDPLSLIRFANPSVGFAASPYSSMWLDKVSCIFTTDGGLRWDQASVNLSDAVDFLPLSTSILLKATDRGIWRLDNFFGQWNMTYELPWFVPEDVPVIYGTMQQFAVLPSGKILALASFETARQFGLLSDSVSRLLTSSDSGVTWDTLWRGSALGFNALVFPTEVVGWLGGEHESIMRTMDGGKSWVTQHTDSLSISRIRALIALDTIHIVAVTGTGTFLKSTDGGLHWLKVIIESSWDRPRTLAFVNPTTGYYGGEDLYLTHDGGDTWVPATDRIRGFARRIQFVSRMLGWVLTDSALYATRDGGYSWQKRYCPPGSSPILSFVMLDSLEGRAILPRKWLETTDGGYTWQTSNIDSMLWPESARDVYAFGRNVAVISEVWLHGDLRTYNLVTTDGGTTWARYPVTTGSFVSSWEKMQFTDPTHFWFANQQGLWLSRDTARTWSLRDSLPAFNSAFGFLDSSRGFCDRGFQSFGYTENGGFSWAVTDKPYPNQSLDLVPLDAELSYMPSAILVGYDGTLIEYVPGWGVHARDTYTVAPLVKIATYQEEGVEEVWILSTSFEILHAIYNVNGVVQARSDLPVTSELVQNFPNPFNPTTNIIFRISKLEQVSLKVYDLLGREVAVLVNERREAGVHEVKFDGSNLASGVYFYRLQAGDFAQTRRLLLLR